MKRKGQSFFEYLLVLTFVCLLSYYVCCSFGQALKNLLNTDLIRFQLATQQSIINNVCSNNINCK
jgi:hypothetical protein